MDTIETLADLKNAMTKLRDDIESDLKTKSLLSSLTADNSWEQFAAMGALSEFIESVTAVMDGLATASASEIQDMKNGVDVLLKLL